MELQFILIIKKYGYKIKRLGKVNLTQKPTYKYDVINSIKMAPNSSYLLNERFAYLKKIKTLSLSVKRKEKKYYFDNIIVCFDKLTPFFVEWLHNSLSINGCIFHLYAKKESFQKHVSANLALLFEHSSPTLNYDSYAWDENENGTYLNFISATSSDHKKNLNLLNPIQFTNTEHAFSLYSDKKIDFAYMISRDEKEGDSEKLYDFLTVLSKEEKGVTNILKLKQYPYFAGLCKWMSNSSNCQRYETAIIGADNSIRICWNGAPIGTVGTPSEDILRNLENINKNKQKERGCNECLRKDSCNKCPFPSPLSDHEFCNNKKVYDLSSKADQLRAFDFFKEYS